MKINYRKIDKNKSQIILQFIKKVHLLNTKFKLVTYKLKYYLKSNGGINTSHNKIIQYHILKSNINLQFIKTMVSINIDNIEISSIKIENDNFPK